MYIYIHTIYIIHLDNCGHDRTLRCQVVNDGIRNWGHQCQTLQVGEALFIVRIYVPGLGTPPPTREMTVRNYATKGLSQK